MANICSAMTKNGVQKVAAPPPLDLDKVKSDKKISDEEILKILEQQISKTSSKKSKKKKKPAKKEESDESDSDE